MEQALEKGELKKVVPLHDQAQNGLRKLAEQGMPKKRLASLYQRLHAVSPQVRELKDWRKWATDQDREFSALAYYDVAAAELEFLETPEHDVSDVGLSHEGRFLTWVTNEGGYSRLHGRDLATGRELPIPDLPPGVYSPSWAAEAPMLALEIRGPRLPGDIWTWDPVSGALYRSTRSSMAGLDPARLIVPTHQDFPARDGEMLHDAM